MQTLTESPLEDRWHRREAVRVVTRCGITTGKVRVGIACVKQGLILDGNGF